MSYFEEDLGPKFYSLVQRKMMEAMKHVNAEMDRLVFGLPRKRLIMSQDVFDAVSLKSLEGKPVYRDPLQLDGMSLQASNLLPAGTVLKINDHDFHEHFVLPREMKISEPFEYKIPMFVNTAGPIIMKPRAIAIMADCNPTVAELRADNERLRARARALKKLIYLLRTGKERGYVSPRLRARLNAQWKLADVGPITKKGMIKRHG